MVLRYFGANWGAPMLAEAEPHTTPVGVGCHLCEQPIQPGDRGVWQPAFRPIQPGDRGLWQTASGPPPRLAARSVPVHAECQLLQAVGHSFGFCSCVGQSQDRQAALRLWRQVHTWQVEQNAKARR